MSIFASRKDQLCKDMDSVYQGLHNASEARLQYAKGWEDFGATSLNMLVSQIPELELQFQDLQKLFSEVAAIHVKLAQEESRNAEDFRDIIERFAVVFRVSEEYGIRKDQWREAQTNYDNQAKKIEIEKAKGTYDKNRFKLDSQLAQCKQDKIDFLRRVKRKCAQLITEKEKYNAFKVRRLRQGWTRYSNALKEASEAEYEVYGKIRDFLAQLKLDNPEAASIAENAINEQITNTPPPAPQVDATAEIEKAEENINHEQPEEKPEEVHNEQNADAQDNGAPAEPLFDNFD